MATEKIFFLPVRHGIPFSDALRANGRALLGPQASSPAFRHD